MYKEMEGDMDTPVSLLGKFLAYDKAILLESANQNKTYSRFSFLSFDITQKLVLQEDGVYSDGLLVMPLSGLNDLLQQNRMPPHGEFGDFAGGYVGYLNFEFVGECNILRSPLRRKDHALGVLYLVEKFCVYDNYTNKLYLANSRRINGSDPDDIYREIARDLDKTEDTVRNLAAHNETVPMQPKVSRSIPRGPLHRQGRPCPHHALLKAKRFKSCFPISSRRTISIPSSSTGTCGASIRHLTCFSLKITTLPSSGPARRFTCRSEKGRRS